MWEWCGMMLETMPEIKPTTLHICTYKKMYIEPQGNLGYPIIIITKVEALWIPAWNFDANGFLLFDRDKGRSIPSRGLSVHMPPGEEENHRPKSDFVRDMFVTRSVYPIENGGLHRFFTKWISPRVFPSQFKQVSFQHGCLWEGKLESDSLMFPPKPIFSYRFVYSNMGTSINQNKLCLSQYPALFSLENNNQCRWIPRISKVGIPRFAQPVLLSWKPLRVLPTLVVKFRHLNFPGTLQNQEERNLGTCACIYVYIRIYIFIVYIYIYIYTYTSD